MSLLERSVTEVSQLSFCLNHCFFHVDYLQQASTARIKTILKLTNKYKVMLVSNPRSWKGKYKMHCLIHISLEVPIPLIIRLPENLKYYITLEAIKNIVNLNCEH